MDDSGKEIIDLNPIYKGNHHYTQCVANLMIILLECICEYFSLSLDNIQLLSDEENEIWRDLLID